MTTSNLQYARSFKSLFFSKSLPFIFVFNLLHFNSRHLNLLKRFLISKNLKFLFLRKNIATNLLFPYSSLSHVFQGPVCVIYPAQNKEHFIYRETGQLDSISKIRDAIMQHFNIFLFLFVRKEKMFLAEPDLKKMELSRPEFFTRLWFTNSFFLSYSLHLVITQLNKALIFPIFLLTQQK
jgi:hypothetical protein